MNQNKICKDVLLFYWFRFELISATHSWTNVLSHTLPNCLKSICVGQT